MIIYLLAFFWFIRTEKAILFWIYLWQLKEYHIGRLLAHFRTEKGKKIFINKLFLLKIILLICFSVLSPLYLVYFLLFVYFIETIKAFKDFFLKKLKRPIYTKKTILLVLTGITVQIVFLMTRGVIWLLIFDILVPLIVSAIVFFFQPIAVLSKNIIIRKARKKRSQFKDLIVIGITGSYGKTSTKDFLYAFLSEKYNVLKTENNQNSEIGISQCILNHLKPEHRFFICEMGAYNKGGIKLLCSIVKPKIGILTGINEQHMATFGSQENIINTKFELIESLPENGIGIFNKDNLMIMENVKKMKVKSKIFCSIKEKADVWTEDIIVKEDSISFKVFSNNDFAEFNLPLLGKQNIENILMAATTAEKLGLNLKEMASGKIKSCNMGMELRKGKFNVIDTTYSANSNGVISHLEYLNVWQGKKAIVMPCLIELGKEAKKVHFQIGKEIGKTCNLAIITSKEYFKEIKKGAEEQGMKNVIFQEKPEKIFNLLKDFSSSQDIILLEGRIPKSIINFLIK